MWGEIEKIKINSQQEAFNTLKKALNGEYDDEKSYLVEFGDWLNFTYKVVGDRYHNTLPNAALKALTTYQAAINNFYANLAYNKKANSLTNEDKKDLELLFHFEEGSSVASAKLDEPLVKISEKAIEKMTGKQILIVILGLALTASLYFGYINHNETKHRKHQLDANVELLREASKTSKELAQLNSDLAKTAMELVKSVPDAKSVSLGELTLSQAEMQEFISREKKALHPIRLDNFYRVTRISETTDHNFRVALEAKDGLALSANIENTADNSELIRSLASSLLDNSFIELKILAKKQGDSIQNASIINAPAHMQQQQTELLIQQDEDSSEDDTDES